MAETGASTSSVTEGCKDPMLKTIVISCVQFLGYETLRRNKSKQWFLSWKGMIPLWRCLLAIIQDSIMMATSNFAWNCSKPCQYRLCFCTTGPVKSVSCTQVFQNWSTTQTTEFTLKFIHMTFTSTTIHYTYPRTCLKFAAHVRIATNTNLTH